MKNIYKKIFFVLFAAVAMTSCEDEDKDPLFVDTDPNNNATFVVITKQTSVIDFTDSSTSYDFTISAPKNNVASIAINVKAAGSALDPVAIASSSSIPADFKIAAADIAAALGVPVGDLNPGDKFEFTSTIQGTDGSTASFANLSNNAAGPGQFQGFDHVTFLSCPFSASEAIGTYTVTNDDFGLANSTFEVIAGPNEETVIVVGLFTENFFMEIDGKTGIAIIPRQPVEAAFFGYSGGNINTSGTSFFFSCAGTIELALQYTVDLGSFGSGIGLSAQKN